MNKLIKIDKKQFLETYNPVNMLTAYRHVNNLAQAIQEDSNGLSVYVKALGYDTVSAVIELHLLALNQSVNVSQHLNKLQIKEIAIEVLASYYYLSPVELAYVLRKAKRGDYGKLYGALNMVDILGWYSQYAEDRVQHFINESTKDRHRDHSLRSEDRKLWERHEKLINKNRE